jgi:hypothetical protein
VRIINGIIFIRTGRDAPERLRVEQLPAPESRLKQVTIAFAPIQASAADTGLRSDIPRTVFGLNSFVGIGFLKIHVGSSYSVHDKTWHLSASDFKPHLWKRMHRPARGKPPLL